MDWFLLRRVPRHLVLLMIVCGFARSASPLDAGIVTISTSTPLGTTAREPAFSAIPQKSSLTADAGFIEPGGSAWFEFVAAPGSPITTLIRSTDLGFRKKAGHVIPSVPVIATGTIGLTAIRR